MGLDIAMGVEERWARRNAHVGTVDFAMMYVAHDAFLRDLAVLRQAALSGTGFGDGAASTWERFARMLRIHHTAEDVALWPLLRSAVGFADQATLDAMEAEHGAIEPALEAVADAMATEGDLGDPLEALRSLLESHLEHEEMVALPLLDRSLGRRGWAAFARHMRKTGGMSLAAEMMPWALDGTPPQVARRALRVLPPPLRLLYRLVWNPRYQVGHVANPQALVPHDYSDA